VRVLVEMNEHDYQSIAKAGFSIRMVRHVAHGLPPATSVLEAACEACGTTADAIRQRPESRRLREIRSKELFVGVARELLQHSYPELARVIGPTWSHTNALYHDRRWKARPEHEEWLPGRTKAETRNLVRARLGMEDLQ
jgi:hypothetical protein